MTSADTKLAFEAGTAGLSLLNQLISMIRQARANGEPEPKIAEVLKRLPAAAFRLSRNLVDECEALRQSYLDAKVDITKTISELEREHWFWFGQKYRLVQGLRSSANALSTVAGQAIDDFMAIARCQDRIDLVAAAFENARKQKEEIESIVTRDVPVEEILKKLTSLARSLRDEVERMT